MKINDLKLPLNKDESDLKKIAEKKTGIKNGYFRILKKSLDARNKSDIKKVFSVEISESPFPLPDENIKEYNYPERILIVGFGPAGMFAGLRLARAGFKPLIIERGERVEDRKKTNDAFFKFQTLNPESNIQFGEGGAGTFSDGKLNTGVNGKYSEYVLSEFVKHGAPEEIKYIYKPHIGSDILPSVVKSIREEIISLGGEIRFNSLLTGVNIKDGKVVSVTVRSNNGNEEIAVDDVILAIGHSSRDTYEALYKAGIYMEKKDCAIGFRVEHLQCDINLAQFGKDIGLTADYKLTSNKADRGVFSFCMCPGGTVVPAASEEGGVVTNGMSEYKRDKENANSAIVCQIRSSDYGDSRGVLSGIDFLRNIEKKAFMIGGGNYLAPCQNITDFMTDNLSNKFGKVKPSYFIGTKFARAEDVLPKFVCDNIRVGLADMNNKIKGFAESGVLTMPETRTSSPVRIVRDENLSAVNVSNLYPSGEVGYAGGIMSSAMDGVKIAEKIKDKYQK